MPVLTHLACIMDGNRRWAKQKGLHRVSRDGIEAAYRAVDFCIKRGVRYLSLFAFSLENFKRAPNEVGHLFDLMVQEINKEKERLIKEKIQVRFVGDRAHFPAHVRGPCEELEAATAAGDVLHVTMLVCYGARQEIADAAQRVARDVQRGVIRADTITSDMFAQYLWTAGTPDPDLVIRTGGVKRLSNFLLYQAAYTELYFLDCLWPAITEQDLERAYTYFATCKRNFGQ